MRELHMWMLAELEEKRVEPNSELGKAYRDMLKRWDKLTLFLHRPGVPLGHRVQAADCRPAGATLTHDRVHAATELARYSGVTL
jgi:hypothetical protein